MRWFNRKTDNELAKLLVERLKATDKNLWLMIGHKFGSWEFPLEFYDLIPDWWRNNGKSIMRAHEVIKPILKEITNEFGKKEELRYHNVCWGQMTNDHFEFWWSNMSLNNGHIYSDTLYKDYYECQMRMEKIHWWKPDVWAKIEPIIKEQEEKEK